MVFIAACTLGTPIIAACTLTSGIKPELAVAADESAEAFVAEIYDSYKGKDREGIRIDTDDRARRYFEPSLAAVISKDEKAAARRHDAPTLDWDPFIDAQDFEISAVDIAVRYASPDKAVATVKFQNVDQPTTVVLDLVKVKSDWRIADITWQREKGKKQTLRKIYSH
jgi:hypothetical protein